MMAYVSAVQSYNISNKKVIAVNSLLKSKHYTSTDLNGEIGRNEGMALDQRR